MEFCKSCGGLMIPSKKEDKLVLTCSKCGKSIEKSEGVKIKETIKHKNNDIDLVDEKQEDKSLPLTDAECPKCGHNKAYYWMVQTRAGDEPETKFLKCEKCRHTWRDYS